MVDKSLPQGTGWCSDWQAICMIPGGMTYTKSRHLGSARSNFRLFMRFFSCHALTAQASPSTIYVQADLVIVGDLLISSFRWLRTDCMRNHIPHRGPGSCSQVICRSEELKDTRTKCFVGCCKDARITNVVVSVPAYHIEVQTLQNAMTELCRKRNF